MRTLVSKRVSQDGKTLDLSGLNIGASGAKQLAKMDLLAGITALHLQGNNIRARGMKALAKVAASCWVETYRSVGKPTW